MAIHRLALAACVLLGLVFNAQAQEDWTLKVDDYVRGEMQQQRIPGVALAIIRAGQVVYAKGYGLANVEHQVTVKPETIFQSGSIGKQFTAAAIMLLVEDGKLNLDDHITKYFKNAPKAWQKITVRHLLTHTAGITRDLPSLDLRRDYTEAQLLKRATQILLDFQPGEKWSYSNLGYVLLGILIHKVTGKLYGEFMQERIFKPLGMTTARLINEADIIPDRAAGYRLVEGELKNQEWVAPTWNTLADGCLYLTLYDMAKWDAALYGEKLLKKASLDQIWTKAKLNNGKTADYGFGWGVFDVGGHRLIAHSGAWQGFRSNIVRYVDDKLTIVTFANLAQADPGKIGRGVAALLNPALALPMAQAIIDSEPQVTAFVKEVLQQAVDRTLRPEQLTPEFATRFFPSGGEQASEFLKPLGVLLEIKLLEGAEENALRTYHYRLVYQEAKLDCYVRLTKDGKLAGLGIRPE